MIAVDALYYGASHRTRMAQWKDENVERELNKFFCGVQVRTYNTHTHTHTHMLIDISNCCNLLL